MFYMLTKNTEGCSCVIILYFLLQRSERRCGPAVQLHNLHHHLDALVGQQAAHPHLSHVLQVRHNLVASQGQKNFEMLIKDSSVYSRTKKMLSPCSTEIMILIRLLRFIYVRYASGLVRDQGRLLHLLGNIRIFKMYKSMNT